MSNEKTTVVRVGPGAPVLLTLLFIALKLTDKIDWAWIWVLCPLWIPFAFIGSMFVFIAVIAMIGVLLDR